VGVHARRLDLRTSGQGNKVEFNRRWREFVPRVRERGIREMEVAEVLSIKR